MNKADREWKKRYSLTRSCAGVPTSAEVFSHKETADKMLSVLCRSKHHRSKDQLASLHFAKGSSVLDIGAGPGTLAVPLAGQGHEVTVVEPSNVMLDAMKVYQQFCGVEAEIPVICETLENVETKACAKYDYVLSSFSMDVPDLLKSLLKMNALCRKQVHIFWFWKNPFWSQMEEDLWSLIHPKEAVAHGTGDLILQCLREEKIAARHELFPLPGNTVFHTIEEAVLKYRPRLGITKPEHEHLLKSYLASRLIRDAQGFYRVPDTGGYAHIWWDAVKI